jgi:hypothetical protein
MHEIATALEEVRPTVTSFQHSGRGGLAVFVKDGDAADQRQREAMSMAMATAKAKHDELTRKLLPDRESRRGPAGPSQADGVTTDPDVLS